VATDALLREALAKRRALGLPSAETSAYRLVHGAADGLEGLTVDVYERYLVASVYTEQDGARERAWLEALARLDCLGVYLKRRPRQANRLREAELQARAPQRAVHGADAPAPLLVREHDVQFEVRLGEGLSTGLFLDQRDNRARFAAQAHGKRVLNLFAYTCAFGVVAARAGALSTTNLDVSKAILERGRRNYALLGAELAPDAHRFLARDVLEALPRLARRGERFDLIALDPPSYASTAHGPFSVERDYPRLVAGALAVLEPGGVLLACTNHARLTQHELLRSIESGARSVGRRTRSVDFSPPPPDFPFDPERPAHLKSAWVLA
jgi:23S rRNA (cytosine1962-C5)-methyltransferase